MRAPAPVADPAADPARPRVPAACRGAPLALAAALLLAGCGVSGAPVPPGPPIERGAERPSGPDVSVTGEARVGVAGRL